MQRATFSHEQIAKIGPKSLKEPKERRFFITRILLGMHGEREGALAGSLWIADCPGGILIAFLSGEASRRDLFFSLQSPLPLYLQSRSTDPVSLSHTLQLMLLSMYVSLEEIHISLSIE